MWFWIYVWLYVLWSLREGTLLEIFYHKISTFTSESNITCWNFKRHDHMSWGYGHPRIVSPETSKVCHGLWQDFNSYQSPTIASKDCLTIGIQQKTEQNMPVKAYAMAQKGSASGSFAESAAVPNPCALQRNSKKVKFYYQHWMLFKHIWAKLDECWCPQMTW